MARGKHTQSDNRPPPIKIASLRSHQVPNVVYGERERRSFLKLNAISLAFTCGALLFLLLALAALVVLPLIIDCLALSGATQSPVELGKWSILLLAVAMMYRYGSSRQKAQWRWLTWGSAFAAIGWLVVSVLFS